MFWKIIFALYSLGLFCIGWLSVDVEHENLTNTSNIEALQGILLLVLLYFMFNILYGLARKIQVLSKTSTIILITLTIITNICLALNPANFMQVNHLSKPLHYLGFIEIMLVLYGIILIPIYIPLISYLKKYNIFERKIKNNFYSSYALMWFISFVLPTTLKNCFLYIKGSFDINPFIDLLVIISNIYILICIYGFIVRKKFIPTKILKITIIPVLIFNYSISNFIEMNKEVINYPIAINIFYTFIIIMEILICYKYIYTDITSNTPDYVDVKIINNFNEKKEHKFLQEIKNKSEVSKWFYVLLIFLLGGLGIHKFYAGKIRVGFLYLILCWTSIPFIISIIELFYSIFQTPDESGKINVY